VRDADARCAVRQRVTPMPDIYGDATLRLMIRYVTSLIVAALPLLRRHA